MKAFEVLKNNMDLYFPVVKEFEGSCILGLDVKNNYYRKYMPPTDLWILNSEFDKVFECFNAVDLAINEELRNKSGLDVMQNDLLNILHTLNYELSESGLYLDILEKDFQHIKLVEFTKLLVEKLNTNQLSSISRAPANAYFLLISQVLGKEIALSTKYGNHEIAELKKHYDDRIALGANLEKEQKLKKTNPIFYELKSLSNSYHFFFTKDNQNTVICVSPTSSRKCLSQLEHKLYYKDYDTILSIFCEFDRASTLYHQVDANILNEDEKKHLTFIELTNNSLLENGFSHFPGIRRLYKEENFLNFIKYLAEKLNENSHPCESLILAQAYFEVISSSLGLDKAKNTKYGGFTIDNILEIINRKRKHLGSEGI